MKIERKTILNDLDYLRQISAPVDFSHDMWKEAISSLDYYCNHEELAMAMAAIQLGYPYRIIYLKKTDLERLDEDYNDARVLINPRVIKSYGLTRFWEACASCLNYTGLVNRPYKIELEYYDIHGQLKHEVFSGFESTVLSHELDHLDGILHIDKSLEILELTPEERVQFRKTHPYEIIRKDGVFIDEVKKTIDSR